MKDAMTDHKAEWVLVPRVATGAMCQAGYYANTVVVGDLKMNHPTGHVWEAMIAAAPAASEGEDGLAEFTDYFIKNYPGPDTIITDPKWHAPRIYRAAQHAMRSRPAAQVAATPKHDEGREESPEFKSGFALGRSESEFLCGLIADPKCDRCGARNPAEAESMCRPSDDSCPGSSWPLENLWNLATQPAARRVTDGVWVEPVVVPGSPHAHIVRFRCGQQRFDIGDALDTMEEAKAFAAMFRRALESFAQPAEGVSGG